MQLSRQIHGNKASPQVDWPSNSPDLNPIQRICTIMKLRILRGRGPEYISSGQRMKEVLIEDWDRITVEDMKTETA